MPRWDTSRAFIDVLSPLKDELEERSKGELVFLTSEGKGDEVTQENEVGQDHDQEKLKELQLRLSQSSSHPTSMMSKSKKELQEAQLQLPDIEQCNMEQALALLTTATTADVEDAAIVKSGMHVTRVLGAESDDGGESEEEEDEADDDAGSAEDQDDSEDAHRKRKKAKKEKVKGNKHKKDKKHKEGKKQDKKNKKQRKQSQIDGKGLLAIEDGSPADTPTAAALPVGPDPAQETPAAQPPQGHQESASVPVMPAAPEDPAADPGMMSAAEGATAQAKEAAAPAAMAMASAEAKAKLEETNEEFSIRLANMIDVGYAIPVSPASEPEPLPKTTGPAAAAAAAVPVPEASHTDPAAAAETIEQAEAEVTHGSTGSPDAKGLAPQTNEPGEQGQSTHQKLTPAETVPQDAEQAHSSEDEQIDSGSESEASMQEDTDTDPQDAVSDTRSPQSLAAAAAASLTKPKAKQPQPPKAKPAAKPKARSRQPKTKASPKKKSFAAHAKAKASTAKTKASVLAAAKKAAAKKASAKPKAKAGVNKGNLIVNIIIDVV